MQFVKMQGTGNDFVVFRPEVEADWPELARRVCDRHFGAGADGIILVLPSSKAALQMRMFNPDGSEAEMCGNGIRCLTKCAVEGGIVALDGGLKVETLAGLRTVWPTLVDGRVTEVRVDMGTPELDPARIPVAVRGEPPVLDYPLTVDGTKLKLSFVSMGNPHAVAFLDTPVADFPLETLGPKVERHALFPERVNFEVANVRSAERIAARVWERGAGLTMACGTGACAVMVAARLKGLVGDWVEMDLPGGTLTLEWDGRGPVYLTGPVESVYRGEWVE